MIFKVDAMDDTLYIEAETLEEAKDQLMRFAGDVPVSMLTWTENVQLPPGEELMARQH